MIERDFAFTKALLDPGATPYWSINGHTMHAEGPWLKNEGRVPVVALEYLERAVATLERIRDHANSGDDPALLAQHELDRIQRKSPA
jgi:hypothetical protein